MLQDNRDILLTMYNFLPKRDLINMLLVCKTWREVGRDKRLWGNVPYDTFRDMITSLDVQLRDFVLSDVIDLKLAKQLQTLWNMDEKGRAEQLQKLVPELWPKEISLQKPLSSKLGAVLLLGRFISKDDLEAIWRKHQRTAVWTSLFVSTYLLSDQKPVHLFLLLNTVPVIKALKSGQCKMDELVRLDPWQINGFKDARGLKALEKGHLTSAIVAKMKTPFDFTFFYFQDAHETLNTQCKP
ncbi:F-box-like domain-containing protein [Legionella cardiaca]|uniref:F-box-like domain-containing protein n=1 Tax=Legionella cardiaca TaxID=1071983 RepID=A0ABY8AQB8_9GAMM|nr:F-box-like domain-containing protein [Legionella cardiaca]WED41979.1 F-box-like domain-containing protein [Legionella cardiaca]